VRVNNLSKVALDSAAAGIELAISSRKSLTTTTPSHTLGLYVSSRRYTATTCSIYLQHGIGNYCRKDYVTVSLPQCYRAMHCIVNCFSSSSVLFLRLNTI